MLWSFVCSPISVSCAFVDLARVTTCFGITVSAGSHSKFRKTDPALLLMFSAGHRIFPFSGVALLLSMTPTESLPKKVGCFATDSRDKSTQLASGTSCFLKNLSLSWRVRCACEYTSASCRCAAMREGLHQPRLVLGLPHLQTGSILDQRSHNHEPVHTSPS